MNRDMKKYSCELPDHFAGLLESYRDAGRFDPQFIENSVRIWLEEHKEISDKQLCDSNLTVEDRNRIKEINDKFQRDYNLLITKIWKGDLGFVEWAQREELFTLEFLCWYYHLVTKIVLKIKQFL